MVEEEATGSDPAIMSAASSASRRERAGSAALIGCFLA